MDKISVKSEAMLAEDPICTFALFGPFAVQCAGRAAKFRRKTRALLAYLIATQRPHSRQALCDLFFAESQDPFGALRWQLSQIRSQLHADVLTAHDLVMRFNPQAATVDCLEFRRILEHPPADQSLETLQAATNLYRGEFLENLDLPDSPEFELWLLGARTEYRQLYALALDEIIARLSDEGQFVAAIPYAQRLVASDPLAEAAQLRLITLYAQAGQRQAALDQFELCRELWRKELALEPSPALQALRATLVASGQLAPIQVAPHQTQRPPENEQLGRPPPVATSQSKTEPTQPPHNLPAQTTAFWGREAELAELTALLTGGETRLVTLVGAGGMGKTRLALRVATTLADDARPRFADGVYFVPLAGAADATLLIPTIAAALGFKLSGSQAPTDQLLTFLRTKQLLLVLDNFEHLLNAAPLLTQVLENSAGVTLLVTSRTHLNLYEEWPFELQGLRVPAASETEGEIEAFSAVQLFLARARRVKHDFALDAESVTIVRICQLLEGMPLAIELAAGWVRTHRCAEIAAEIQRNFDFLASNLQNLPERHRSMRAVFEHSWHLLSAQEQNAFARLSVFRGGFDHKAAEYVAGITRHSLAQLIDKSMLQVVAAGAREARYHVHELLRQFGEEKLPAADLLAVGQLHSSYYAAFVQQREPCKHSAQEIEALAELSVDLENVRAGWQWATLRLAALEQAPSAARLLAVELIAHYAPMLAFYFQRWSRQLEGVQLFQPVVALLHESGRHEPQLDDPPHAHALASEIQLTMAKVMMGEALLCWGLGEFTNARQNIEAALAIFRRHGSERELAEALVIYGKTLWRTGENEAAIHCYNESLTIARHLNDRATIALALNGLANIASNRGRFAESQSLYEECLAILRDIGAQRDLATSLNGLGSNYSRRGNPLQAREFYEEAYRLASLIGEKSEQGVALSGMGCVYHDLGQFEQATDYNQQALALFRGMGNQRWIAACLNLLGLIALDQRQFTTAWGYLHEALSTALAINSVPDALDSLAALGETMAEADATADALTLLHFVAHHPVTRVLARARIASLLDRLQAQVEPTRWESAHHLGTAKSFETFAREVPRWHSPF